MIVEQVDAFKTWLTAVLKPMCEADPAALAKYVLALIKKDKSEDELRKSMVGQLDVFLEGETESFVDLVFQTLTTKEYMNVPVIPNTNPPNPNVSKAGKDTVKESKIIIQPSELPNLSETVNGDTKKELEAKKDKEIRKNSDTEREERPARRRSLLRPRSTSRNRTRSRSRSWDRIKRSRSREKSRERLDRERLDRDQHRVDRDKRDRSERSRFWRNKSPPRRYAPRRTSRTPSPIRIRSRSRSPRHSHRNRYRNRSSVSRSRSKSLEKRDHRDLLKEKEKDGASRPGTPTPESNQGDLDVRLSSAQNALIPQGGKKRCRDFDEKGYCMRGEMCPFDHGIDPVVLEDTALTRVLTYNPNGTPAVVSSGVIPTPVLTAPGHPMMGQRHPMQPDHPYNPQAPHIWRDNRFRGPRPMGIARVPPMGAFPPQSNINRELIPIPVMDNKPPEMYTPMYNQQQNFINNMDHENMYKKKAFDFNRLGPRNKNPQNCSLELKKVPITKLDDFWRFYEKYKTLNALKTSDFDKNKLLNVNFIEKTTLLYDKLPVLDKRGNRVQIPLDAFKSFLTSVKVYQDFQQKSTFAKLKKLRQSQNDLPIAQHKTEIIDKLENARVLLIAGDTGCGKSTQVPQYVLEAGYNKIVCTQPRRIACVSLAKRVAYETLTDFQNTVGYQIRFEKTKRADTKIVFMTEGLLLRQASEQETLSSYDVIILDEVHERNLYGDFLIGIMKCLLHQRSNFKLILMSATINITLFSDYFASEHVQVIQVPGRLYPIDIQYKPIVRDPYERKREKLDCTPYLQILQMIDEKYAAHQKGDMLVFLNGFSEISTLADAVAEYAESKKNWIVLPLHSTLSLEEQDKVFDYPPEGVRKCIISTNIAETSVTIDGIRFVIDSGKVNRMTYNTNVGVNKLSECNISQDSAKQRAGRAGRTGPGTCFRLYSEEDFRNFEAFTPAEVHQVPLDSLLLHMIALGLSDIANFPFIEKPATKSLEESMEKLKFIGALRLDKEDLALTPLGDALSQLPVDLAIGKMLIMSTIFGNVNSVLAVASLLSVQSPLTQTAQRNSDAQDLRQPLESNHGDPVTLLNFYKEWLTIKQTSTPAQHTSSRRGGGESSKMWSKKRCLEEQRFYEATKLIEQFRDILQEAELLPKIEEGQLSGGERAIRHGELKQLKSMRYRLKTESKSAGRKQLKYEMYADERGDEETTDIRDVEFRIANDFKRLQKLLNETSSDSYKDLMMLKLILTSGLYPQIAVEDEFNSSKTVSERLYHTKNKNYLFLRPLNYFAVNPEILELHNDDIEVPPPGYFSKRPISRKHQVLVYQSILETKKVYLVNTMRMPAIQTALLFGKTVATNSTLTQFLVDDFLVFDVPHVGQGKTLLLRAVSLRKKWKTKLEAKLRNPKDNIDANAKENFYFIEDLVAYMNSEVSYNVRRLLPADLKEIYTFDTNFFEREKFDGNTTHHGNPFDVEFVIVKNYDVGGVNVTENVVFDCLQQEQWALDIEEGIYQTTFECRYCKRSKLGSSLFAAMQHETFCSAKVADAEMKGEKEEEEEEKTVVKANSKPYHCTVCQKDLLLTPIDILKHKKTCK